MSRYNSTHRPTAAAEKAQNEWDGGHHWAVTEQVRDLKVLLHKPLTEKSGLWRQRVLLSLVRNSEGLIVSREVEIRWESHLLTGHLMALTHQADNEEPQATKSNSWIIANVLQEASGRKSLYWQVAGVCIYSTVLYTVLNCTGVNFCHWFNISNLWKMSN